MAQRIFKYTVQRGIGEHVLRVHKYHEKVSDPYFLDAQMQGDMIALWFLVDPDLPVAEFNFSVEGTNQDLQRDVDYVWDANHLATVQDGPFVWHLFQHYDEEEDHVAKLGRFNW